MSDFQMEWEGRFPAWVKQEIVSGNQPYGFYNSHLNRLAMLDVEMRQVWELLQSKVEIFPSNPVIWLLKLLHRAYLGLDPEQDRDQEEKKIIASDLRKSLEIADTWISRLMQERRNEEGKITSSSYVYPFVIEDRIQEAIHEEFRTGLGYELRSAGKHVISHLKELGIGKEGRKLVFEDMTSTYAEVEGSHAAMLKDVRLGLTMLVEAAEEWAETTWAYKQFIVSVGQEMKAVLGSKHPEVVATLASAIFQRTVSVGAVREMLRREGV